MQARTDLPRRQLQDVLDWAQGRIAASFFCPHRPEEGCPCRKPKPGLLLRDTDLLAHGLNQVAPEQKVELVVLRGGEKKTYTIAVGK